ncbi:cell envelope biogenesis protein OmpA [Arenibacter aquaticus]|uniref:Cell envelope biogenesis protein OmpA n=1 Tax=Arenibacter aquaticus TaxID=2489054 RepID=A0A3S0ABQ6_9FLAO|nr:PD40 domain-containing protein [Arenibacter aquaticus]RTE51788.1 cell envelope biogenesis protein OmpA [Arenibacter aquaticus]
MNNSMNYKGILGCFIMLFCSLATAQHSKTYPDESSQLASKRMAYYEELHNMGFKDSEIFQDLGNANFLAGNYGEAVFWYHKLMELPTDESTSKGYTERYNYALNKIKATNLDAPFEQKDWVAEVKADYQLKNDREQPSSRHGTQHKFKELDFLQEDKSNTSQALTMEDLGLEDNLGTDQQKNSKFSYSAPVAVTADGNTAYFSKATYTKPVYGLFSKKQIVHKIFKAKKVNGKWHNVEEVALAPNNSSTIHPTISPDGKRLFFASDMPGTFGKYDIYVADIKSDGSFGVAKNLGQKVNTEDNDLYPKFGGGSSLFFASEGRDGFGGLDVYMVQVDKKKVSPSVNLGSPINSHKDDFSISLMANSGIAYVMSNRGDGTNKPQQLAFSYSNDRNKRNLDKKDFNSLEAIQENSNIDYSTSVFEE